MLQLKASEAFELLDCTCLCTLPTMMLLADVDKLSRILKKEVSKVDSIKEICTLWAGYGRILEAKVILSGQRHIKVILKVHLETEL